MKALTLSALAATLLAGCGDATAETTSDPAAVTVPAAPETRVEAARIEPSAAALDLMLPGEVSGSKDARLASANGGYVEKVLVKRGQSVRAGQALAYIDTRTHRAQREQAQAQHDLAVSEAGRLDKLGDHATASQKAQASTQVAVTKAALDMAEARAARAVVTAPFPGVIGQVAVEEGEVLGPGSPVARLVQLDPVHVTVSVSDRDVGALRVGQRVRVSTDAVPRIFDGDLVAIDPAADLNTRTFLAEIAVPNPGVRFVSFHHQDDRERPPVHAGRRRQRGAPAGLARDAHGRRRCVPRRGRRGALAPGRARHGGARPGRDLVRPGPRRPRRLDRTPRPGRRRPAHREPTGRLLHPRPRHLVSPSPSPSAAGSHAVLAGATS